MVDAPHNLSVVDIRAERNQKVQRIMIERYGTSRFLKDARASVVDHDDCGTLYRTRLGPREDFSVVGVVNSTPEPDGTYKHYYLKVPPTLTSARAAVAWTFGLDEDEYRPLLET